MKPKNLKKIYNQWAKILRVQDWNVDLSLSSSPLPVPTAQGCTRIVPTFKDADIMISSSLNKSDDEIEQTLIHEMIHLLLPTNSMRDPDDMSGYGLELEIAVETLSRALWTLSKKENKIEGQTV